MVMVVPVKAWVAIIQRQNEQLDQIAVSLGLGTIWSLLTMLHCNCPSSAWPHLPEPVGDLSQASLVPSVLFAS